MKKTIFWLLLAFFPLFLSRTNVHADQIILTNGDRISGEILRIINGEVVIVTEYAGEVPVDFNMVVDMRTDAPGRLALDNGDLIRGRIVSLSDDMITIESEILKTLTIPRASLSSLNEVESAELEQTRKLLEQSESALKDAQVAVEQKEKEIERLTSFSELWDGSFSVGAQLNRGNTDTSALHVEATAARKMPREELELKFRSDYGETDGETDTNTIFGESKLKVFQTDRRYLFGVTNMEYDEMENLDLRAQVFAGPGYVFVKNERTRVLGEVGAGLTGEFFEDEEETLEAGMWINAEWKQKLFDHAEFFQGLTVYPSLGNPGDYRLRSTTTLKTPLSERWAMKLSLIDDYDSDPEAEDTKKNDLQFISAMEYGF